MKELRKMKAGHIVPPAFSRWPSWEVDVASDEGEGLERQAWKMTCQGTYLVVGKSW